MSRKARIRALIIRMRFRNFGATEVLQRPAHQPGAQLFGAERPRAPANPGGEGGGEGGGGEGGGGGRGRGREGGGGGGGGGGK